MCSRRRCFLSQRAHFSRAPGVFSLNTRGWFVLRRAHLPRAVGCTWKKKTKKVACTRKAGDIVSERKGACLLRAAPPEWPGTFFLSTRAIGWRPGEIPSRSARLARAPGIFSLDAHGWLALSCSSAYVIIFNCAHLHAVVPVFLGQHHLSGQTASMLSLVVTRDPRNRGRYLAYGVPCTVSKPLKT
eukprot:566226-Prorocentrum_minimum.AAC.1